jgi:hypothetical protein
MDIGSSLTVMGVPVRACRNSLRFLLHGLSSSKPTRSKILRDHATYRAWQTKHWRKLQSKFRVHNKTESLPIEQPPPWGGKKISHLLHGVHYHKHHQQNASLGGGLTCEDRWRFDQKPCFTLTMEMIICPILDCHWSYICLFLSCTLLN